MASPPRVDGRRCEKTRTLRGAVQVHLRAPLLYRWWLIIARLGHAQTTQIIVLSLSPCDFLEKKKKIPYFSLWQLIKMPTPAIHARAEVHLLLYTILAVLWKHEEL